MRESNLFRWMIYAATASLVLTNWMITAVAQDEFHPARQPTSSPWPRLSVPVPKAQAWRFPPVSDGSERALQLVAVLEGEHEKHATPSSNAQNADTPPSVVLHAGGAVELRVPSDWVVKEVAVGRQVRLLVSPHEIDDAQVDVADGFWLSLRYQPDGLRPLSHQQLGEMTTKRLLQMTRDQATLESPKQEQLGESRWTRVNFQLPAHQPDQNQRGFYVLQQTGWARCEAFAMLPGESTKQRQDEIEAILTSLRLRRPDIKTVPSDTTVSSAAAVIGSWKAFQSRLRLGGDGQVTVVTDKPFQVPLPVNEQGRDDSQTPANEDLIEPESMPQDSANPTTKQSRVLVGQFRAQEDLLFIVWNDGSKLNYRWRLHQGKLLLSDHKGRTTQLWRLLE